MNTALTPIFSPKLGDIKRRPWQQVTSSIPRAETQSEELRSVQRTPLQCFSFAKLLANLESADHTTQGCPLPILCHQASLFGVKRAKNFLVPLHIWELYYYSLRVPPQKSYLLKKKHLIVIFLESFFIYLIYQEKYIWNGLKVPSTFSGS